MKNEVIGARVRKIAGRVLQRLADMRIGNDEPSKCHCYIHSSMRDLGITVEDLKALAASALTQSPDRKKAKVKP